MIMIWERNKICIYQITSVLFCFVRMSAKGSVDDNMGKINVYFRENTK